MTDLRKAAQMALETLETLDAGDTYKTHNAASALRQALAMEKFMLREALEAAKKSQEQIAALTAMCETLNKLQETAVNMIKPAVAAAVQKERDRIVNLLMIQHEAAKGKHNYWQVAANLVQADVASDT